LLAVVAGQGRRGVEGWRRRRRDEEGTVEAPCSQLEEGGGRTRRVRWRHRVLARREAAAG